MHTMQLVVLFALASVTRMAYAQGNLAEPYVSEPQMTIAFTVNAGRLIVDQSYAHTISNMPKIWSQAAMPTCYGCAAAAIVQKYICDNEISLNTTRCDATSLDMTVSQLGMIAWADTNKDRMTTKEGEKQIAGQSRNHRNLKLLDETTAFSSGSNALMNSARLFRFKPESCFPVAQAVNSFTNARVFEEVHRRARKLYNSYKSQPNINDETSLVAEMRTLFSREIEPDAIRRGLGKETFPEFLYEALLGKCADIKIGPYRPTFKRAPDGTDQTIPKADVFSVIKNVLDREHPILVNSVCLDYNNTTKRCSFRHSVVLSGYRRVCNRDSNSTCQLELKVHNCWGERWQHDSNDGWVDADRLIASLNPGSTFIESGELSWLE